MTDATGGPGRMLADTRTVKPVRMAHVVLRTMKVAQLVEWYTTVFHAEVVFNNGALAFLHFDDEHHRFAIGEVKDLEEPNHNAAGFDHVAFSYESMDHLLETYDRLKGLGIEPFFNVDHGVTTSLYYQDPDGNKLELQVDNFSSLDEAHGYFRSPAFLKNPIGIEIDPDDLLKRYRSGVDAADLLSSGTRHPIH